MWEKTLKWPDHAKRLINSSVLEKKSKKPIHGPDGKNTGGGTGKKNKGRLIRYPCGISFTNLPSKYFLSAGDLQYSFLL
jgi:hypothetical protein